MLFPRVYTLERPLFSWLTHSLPARCKRARARTPLILYNLYNRYFDETPPSARRCRETMKNTHACPLAPSAPLRWHARARAHAPPIRPLRQTVIST